MLLGWVFHPHLQEKLKELQSTFSFSVGGMVTNFPGSVMALDGLKFRCDVYYVVGIFCANIRETSLKEDLDKTVIFL